MRWQPLIKSLCCLIFLSGTSGVLNNLLEASSTEELPLRLSEPVETVIRDLQIYIPDYMHQQNIPGSAIALIQGGKVVWSAGFGVKNTITSEPVTVDTLFEVASNSKVMTAYIALRMVDQGRLALDEPLNGYLSEPWLPPSEYRDVITLRHVLSHSAGLGHNSLSRENLFPPSHGYSYSGMGFLYLQEVIEEVAGQSLEEVARELLFVPVGMTSSSFVNRKPPTYRTANGHLWAAVPAIFFAVLFGISLVIVGLLGVLVLRIRAGRWYPTKRMAIIACSVAFFLSFLPAFMFLVPLGLSEFAWLIAFCGLFLTVMFVLLFSIGRVLIQRVVQDQSKPRIILTGVWILIVLAGLGLFSSSIQNLPVPRWPPVPAGAASSVRATVGDVSKFLIELSSSRLLSPELAAQLQTPQVRLSNDLSWGLGPGIQHSGQGDALWQWGQHIDFQSFMIIYPSQGFGVVVVTNNDLLNPDVAIHIAHRALGGKIEPILHASRTEFNYRLEGS